MKLCMPSSAIINLWITDAVNNDPDYGSDVLTKAEQYCNEVYSGFTVNTKGSVSVSTFGNIDDLLDWWAKQSEPVSDDANL